METITVEQVKVAFSKMYTDDHKEDFVKIPPDESGWLIQRVWEKFERYLKKEIDNV